MKNVAAKGQNRNESMFSLSFLKKGKNPCTLLEFLPTNSERNTYVFVCRGNLPTVFEVITYDM